VNRTSAKAFVLALLLAPSLAAAADLPNACAIVKAEDLNQIAGGGIVGKQQRKSGNPSECSFVDARHGSVVVIKIQQVQYAAENELQHERETLEKIYRSRAKWLNTVGDQAFWLEGNKQLVFRKAKTLGWVTFERAAQRNEVDSAQVARLVEAHIK